MKCQNDEVKNQNPLKQIHRNSNTKYWVDTVSLLIKHWKEGHNKIHDFYSIILDTTNELKMFSRWNFNGKSS